MGLVVTESLRSVNRFYVVMRNTKTGQKWYRESQQAFVWTQDKRNAWQFSGGSIKETLRTTRARQNWPYIEIESEEV